MATRYPQLTARDRANLDVLARDDEDLDSRLDPKESKVDREESKRQRLHGKARARALARQIAEGPTEILTALNLLHGFRLAHRDPSHPRRARRLQLALGPWGRSFYGPPALLEPLVSALEVMAGLVTNTGLHKQVDTMVAEAQAALNMHCVNARVEVDSAIEKILGPHTIPGRSRTLLGGNAPPVDPVTRMRAGLAACQQSPELVDTMVRGWNYRVAMALLARLSAAPPEWRSRVYRCGGPACKAPYQIWLAQPGAGRPPKRGAKPAARARVCRPCRSRVSGNSRVKQAKAPS